MPPGKGEIKSNPQVYTTQEGRDEIEKKNPGYTLPIRGYKRD